VDEHVESMKALKSLRAGAIGPFGGFSWPTPTDGAGAWVEAAADPCATGIHAFLPEQLPLWLQDELWEIELAGDIVQASGKLVAERGRLLRRIEAWNEQALDDFGRACLGRLLDLAAVDERAAGYAEDGRRILAEHESMFVAFVSARAAEVVRGPDAYDAERAWQAGWLANRLGVDDALRGLRAAD
jgi:hypothetical protein